MKITRWDIFEELKTEDDIQAFVEASIAEAANDTDPRLLAHTLRIAAKAREMLASHGVASTRNARTRRLRATSGDPRISTFDKIARSLGYHLTLAPVQQG